MAQYFVDADAAPGGDGSEETPWDTASDINFGIVGAGDQVHFSGALSERLNVGADGSTGSPLRLVFDVSSTLDAAGETFGIVVGGATFDRDYVHVEGAVVSNATADNVLDATGATTGNHYLKVKSIDAGDDGFRLDNCAELVVSGCLAENATTWGFHISNCPASVLSSLTARNCGTAGANNHDGVGVDDGSHGTSLFDIYVEGSKSDDGSGIDLQVSDGTNEVTLHRAVVLDGDKDGLAVTGAPDATCVSVLSRGNAQAQVQCKGESQHVNVYQATLLGGADGLKAGNTVATNIDVTFRNSIAIGDTRSIWYADGVSAVLDSDFNCFGASPSFFINGTGDRTLAQWRTDTSQDSNSLDVDPGFISSTDNRLDTDSPCIAAGTRWMSAPVLDVSGLRFNFIPSLGAYEYRKDKTYTRKTGTLPPSFLEAGCDLPRAR